MNRIASTVRVLGLSVALVVGMSASGVASTSRHAAGNVSAPRNSSALLNSSASVNISVPGERQVVKQLTREEQSGMKALALIKFGWQEALPGWRIRFLPARKGYLAITFREQRRIDVYVRLDRSTTAVAHDIAHELGHAVDVTYLNDERRAAILQVRGLKADTNWWACNACTDLQTGAGDFAETFALIAAPRYKFYSDLGDEPTSEMLAEVSAIVTDSLAV